MPLGPNPPDLPPPGEAGPVFLACYAAMLLTVLAAILGSRTWTILGACLVAVLVIAAQVADGPGRR